MRYNIKKIIIYIIVLIAVSSLCLCLIIKFEKNKINPMVRYYSSNGMLDIDDEGHLYPAKRDYIDSGIASFEYEGINYEFTNYKIVSEEDIAGESDINLDLFCEPFDTEWQVEIFDYEKLRNDDVEFYNEIVDWYKYDEKKAEEIGQKFELYHNDYMAFKHPTTYYLFLKCKLTNVSDTDKKDVALAGLNAYMRKDKDPRVPGYGPAYFDKSQNKEEPLRSQKYFDYMFEPNETVECVLGFKIYYYFNWINVENSQIYVGYNDNVNLEDELTQNKSELGPEFSYYMFNARDINEY